MRSKTWRIMGVALALLGAVARAEDGAPVEPSAVTNRLYGLQGRWEVGARASAPLMAYLTQTYNFTLSAAYSPLEWLAVEARGGYALSANTLAAAQVALSQYESSAAALNELSGTWTMRGNGILGLRLQPIYGKLSVFADVPVHFSAYVWAGGGVASLARVSPSLCLYPKSSAGDPKRCVVTDGSGTHIHWENFVSEQRVAPIVSLALGARLFLAGHHALSLEVRSWSYADAFLQGVAREEVSPDTPTGGGTRVAHPGFTHLAQVDLGYIFVF